MKEEAVMLVICGLAIVLFVIVLLMYKKNVKKKKLEKREKIELLMKEMDITYQDMYEHPSDKETLLMKEYASYIWQSERNKG